jgi:ABC-type nitrate/sulfonate/bicarbonate transport system permease component
MTSIPDTGTTRSRAGAGVGIGFRAPVLLGFIGLASFAALLELLPRAGVVPAEYFPPTSRIVGALADQLRSDAFWVALGQTLVTWLTGLGIAASAGIVLGLLIGSVPWLRALTASTIEFLRPIPSVALIPVVAVLYGSDRTSTVILVVYASFWQVLIQVLVGVVDVDPVAMDTARSYRLSRLRRVVNVIWPTTLPYAITGFRLATSVALILTITGELVVGTPGLGKLIETAYTSNAVAVMYALVVVTGLIGVLANLGTRTLERVVLAWHPSVRKDVVA